MNGSILPLNSLLKNNEIFFVDKCFYLCIVTAKLNF